MADRTQRLKGKANEAAGEAKANAGYATGSGKTEAKGVGKPLKGKAQQTAGKARSEVTSPRRSPRSTRTRPPASAATARSRARAYPGAWSPLEKKEAKEPAIAVTMKIAQNSSATSTIWPA